MSSFNINRLVKALFLLVLSEFVCDASSLTVPRSSVAVIGERVELKCSADGNQQVYWGFTSFNTSKDTDIYNGNNISSPFKSRYTIDKRIRGQHTLVIDSVDLDHAGKYQCVRFDTGNKTVMNLTVLLSYPECSSNTSNADGGIMEKGYLWMWCRIVYTGSMIPIFNWTKANIESAIAANTIIFDNSRISFIKTSSFKAQLHYDDNGIVFKCTIKFQSPSDAQGNAPEFEYKWNYTANVLYGPRNLSIVEYEDRLECSADGNPTPTYRWTNLETNRSVEGPVLLVDKALDSNKIHYVECTAAVNGLGAQMKNISYLNNGSTSDSVTSLRTVVAAAVGVGSLLLLLIIITVSCFVRKKKLTGLTKIHVSFIGRSVSVEPDIIDVDIYSYGDIAFNRQPPSEHEQNGSNAFRVLENHGRDSDSIPVYAEVKKGNVPVYADVKMKKKANESLNRNSTAAFELSDDNSPSPQVSIQKKKRQNRVGADGTEYLDISEVRQPFNMSTVRAATLSAFNRTNYAVIDHTARVPPPPPKL